MWDVEKNERLFASYLFLSDDHLCATLRVIASYRAFGRLTFRVFTTLVSDKTADVVIAEIFENVKITPGDFLFSFNYCGEKC